MNWKRQVRAQCNGYLVNFFVNSNNHIFQSSFKLSTKDFSNCRISYSGCTIHFYYDNEITKDEYYESKQDDDAIYVIYRKVEGDGDITGWAPQYSCSNIPVQVNYLKSLR